MNPKTYKLISKFNIFLQKHPLTILLVLLFAIAGATYKTLDGWYEREYSLKNQERNQELKSKIAELDSDRAQLKISIGSSVDVKTNADFFADLTSLDSSYSIVANRLFAVKKIADSNGDWVWSLRSERELMQETLGAAVDEISELEGSGLILDTKEIACYESPSTVTVKIHDFDVAFRSRATFRFISWETFQKVANAAAEAQSKQFFSTMSKSIDNISERVGISLYEDLLTSYTKEKWLKISADEKVLNVLVDSIANVNVGRAHTFFAFASSKISPEHATMLERKVAPIRKALLEEKKKEEAEAKEKNIPETKVEPLTIALSQFVQLGSQPPGIGTFHPTDYSFRREIYSIQGYFEVPRANGKPLRLQLVSLGIISEKGIYVMEFRALIEENWSDAQRLLSLIKGAKIIL